jgi:GAF domain-containing protein
MLDVALRYLEAATKTDYNQIFLAAAADYGSILVAVANSITPGKQEYRLASFGGLLGHSFLNGKIINAANVKNWQNYFNAVGETKSELVVPIVKESLVLGLLNAESEVENHFDGDIVHRVKLLADASAEALVQYGWNPALRQAGLPWVRRFPQGEGTTEGVAGTPNPRPQADG